VLSIAGVAWASITGVQSLRVLHAWAHAARSLAGSPQGPVMIDGTVSMVLPGERVISGAGGEGVLRDDDYDTLAQGAFGEAGPQWGDRVVFIGCASVDPSRGSTLLTACKNLPSAIRHDTATFLDTIRNDACRDLLSLAVAFAIGGLWVASTWLAMARRRAGSQYLAEDSVEVRLALPVWIHVAPDAAPEAGDEPDSPDPTDAPSAHGAA
jgi:hypothetical protein